MVEVSDRPEQKTGHDPEKKMPITGHFNELRQRFLHSLIAIVVGVVLGFVFANQIFAFLEKPAGPDFHPVFIEMTEMMGTYFQVCLMAGFIIAMPFLLYQLIAFIAPALTGREKRFVFIAIPVVVGMFLIGAAFAYYVALPPAIYILTHWGGNIAVAQIRIGNYISIVTRLILVIGLVFEMPFLLMVLARLGVVRSQWLASKFKWWIILAFVASAIITPTFDPINQTIIAVPLILLYVLSIWLTRLVQKKRVPEAIT